MFQRCSRFSSSTTWSISSCVKLLSFHNIRYSHICYSLNGNNIQNNKQRNQSIFYHQTSYQYSTKKEEDEQNEDIESEETEQEDDEEEEEEEQEEEIEAKHEDDDEYEDEYETEDDDEDMNENEPSPSEKFLIQYRQSQGLQYEPSDDSEFKYKPIPRMPGPSPFINHDYKKQSVYKYSSIEEISLPLSSVQPIGGHPEIWIHSSNATKKSIYKLSPDLFNQDIRIDILWRSVRYERHHQKGWTWHVVRHRGEIHGTGRKLRQQKGTGKARMSDGKAPQFKNGGTAHGRRPKSVATYLPKSVYYLALKIALTARYQEGDLYVWEDFVLPRLAKPKINDGGDAANTMMRMEHETNPHPELNDTLIPIHDLDNNDNTKLYYDVHKTRQMLNKWGWLKPQIYERVNNHKTFNLIQSAKKSGNIVDILESMPIAEFEWDFLKEEDELIDHTIPTILMIHDGFIHEDFKEAMKRVHGIDLICYDELLGVGDGKQHKPNMAVFRLLKYKKIVFSVAALKSLEDKIGVEAEVKKWNYYAKLNRIRQDEQYPDAFPNQHKNNMK